MAGVEEEGAEDCRGIGVPTVLHNQHQNNPLEERKKAWSE